MNLPKTQHFFDMLEQLFNGLTNELKTSKVAIAHLVASEREITELEVKSAKWDDPQTQADLELGRQVRGLIERLDVCSDFELVKWFREQKEREQNE